MALTTINANSAKISPRQRSFGTSGAGAAVMSGGVTPRVRNEREEAGALDCRRQLPLVAGARSAQPARQDLAVVGDEASERAVVLVVDEADTRLAEGAGFLWSSH